MHRRADSGRDAGFQLGLQALEHLGRGAHGHARAVVLVGLGEHQRVLVQRGEARTTSTS